MTHRVQDWRDLLSSGWATFFIAFILASPIIVWGFDRTPPVTVYKLDMEPHVVYPGQKVVRSIEVLRRRACQTDVDIVLIDGNRVRWIIDEPSIVAPGPVGVRDAYGQPMTIPAQMAPGPAEMRITTRRVCNPLQHIWPLVTQSPTVYFEVADPRPSSLPAPASPAKP